MQFCKYVPDRRDGSDVRTGAFRAFLNEIAEHNSQIVCPKCHKIHDFGRADFLTSKIKVANGAAPPAVLSAGKERMRTQLQDSDQLSLQGIHSTIDVPRHQAGFWRQWRSFVGPAILISVGYMDPGNWGTDLQGGARFQYGLLWVVGLASLMAIVMQVISARLGVVTGKDLAQMLPRLVPQMDPLAQLAAERGGNWGL